MSRSKAVTSSGSLDPHASGAPVKIALIVEAIATLAVGILVIINPGLLLAHLVHPVLDTTPVVFVLTQFIGALSLVFGFFCVAAVPDTRHAVESRRTLYLVLGLGEGSVILLLCWQLFFWQGLTPTSEETALLRSGLWKGIQQMGPAVAWRAWVLFIKPQWLGRWIDADKKE